MIPPVPTERIASADAERVLRLAEAANDVKRKHQFFLWLQANLQCLIPHKLCVCGAYDRALQDIAFESLFSVPVPTDVLGLLAHAEGPVLRSMCLAWFANGHQPTVVALDSLGVETVSVDRLQAAGYSHVLVHGVTRPGGSAEIESFFVFASPQTIPTPSAVGALGVLLPYIHSTYVRVHATERELQNRSPSVAARTGQSSLGPVVGRSQITERELEILRWVRDGKSNQEIGLQLAISALTVKNHIQKILRKLGAANRAQAVSMVMSMNLLGMNTNPVNSSQVVGTPE